MGEGLLQQLVGQVVPEGFSVGGADGIQQRVRGLVNVLAVISEMGLRALIGLN